MPAWLITWLYRNRTAVEVAAAVLLLAGIALAWNHHAETVGAQKCEQANTAQAVTELRGDLVESSRQADAVAGEARKNASDNLQPLSVPAVRVCYYEPAATNAVHGAAAAGPIGNGGMGPGGGDSERARQIADVEASYQSLAAVGRRARAQLVELQAYVRDVCKPATPPAPPGGPR